MLRVAVGDLLVPTASHQYYGSGAENRRKLRLYQQIAIRHNIRVTNKSVKFFYGLCRLLIRACNMFIVK